MKDVDKRREYDRIYTSILNGVNSQSTKSSRSSTAAALQLEERTEVAQIDALQKQKGERVARWSDRRNVLEASIFELRREFQQLEQEIKYLASIAAAEAALEASKNSWATWVLSPFYKQVRESENGKARKEKECQERRTEKDLKERRWASQQAQLREQEEQMEQAKKDFDAAGLIDDQAIDAIEAKKRNRDVQKQDEREMIERQRRAELLKQQQEQHARERRESERLVKEKLAKRKKAQQEQWEKEAQRARDVLKKQQSKARAAESARQEEYRRSQQRRILHSGSSNGCTRKPYTSKSSCEHHGWWNKILGRAACPRCDDVWNYMLQCPGCSTEACPKCQSEVRPRHVCWRDDSRPRSPSPWGYDHYHGYM